MCLIKLIIMNLSIRINVPVIISCDYHATVLGSVVKHKGVVV